MHIEGTKTLKKHNQNPNPKSKIHPTERDAAEVSRSLPGGENARDDNFVNEDEISM